MREAVLAAAKAFVLRNFRLALLELFLYGLGMLESGQFGLQFLFKYDH
jgi:hypothetical protein